MNINLTLLGQMITFGIFVWFCMKYIWPPIVKALEERKSKIAEGLAAAERAHQEQELGEKRAAELIKEAKLQASEIVAIAQKRAGEIVDAAKTDAKTEGERIINAAHGEVDVATNRAREELRAQFSELAIAAAEKILRKEINPKTHKALIDEFAKQI